jgi:flagellar assembly protein FliH
VDGAGKKSLSESGGGTAKNRQPEIQLHCFPDITCGTSTAGPECVPYKNVFKRTHFDAADTDCSQSADDMDPAPSLSAVEEIEKQAYQNGFEEGQKSALELQKTEVAAAIQSLGEAVAEIQNLRPEIYQSIEHEVVELALSIARKVVCQEIQTQKDVVVCVAREALSQVDVPGKIKIRLNPADLKFITETQDQISKLQQHMDNVTFEAEEEITAGGCVIETGLGEIDARIEKQFQVVEDKFRSEFAQSQPERNLEDNS